MKRFVPFFCAVVGCSTHSPWLSRDVGTRDMSIMLKWTDDGSLAASITGPGGPVTFEEGERVYLLRDGREISFSRASDGWRATLGAETGTFVFALDRVWDSGARVYFEVPSPFAVSAPPAASRANPLVITWDASPEGRVTLSVEGPCIVPFSRPLATDTGRYTINPGEVTALSMPGGSCTVEVEVLRTIEGGSGATGLSSFSYRAERAARTAMVSTP